MLSHYTNLRVLRNFPKIFVFFGTNYVTSSSVRLLDNVPVKEPLSEDVLHQIRRIGKIAYKLVFECYLRQMTKEKKIVPVVTKCSNPSF